MHLHIPLFDLFASNFKTNLLLIANCLSSFPNSSWFWNIIPTSTLGSTKSSSTLNLGHCDELHSPSPLYYLNFYATKKPKLLKKITHVTWGTFGIFKSLSTTLLANVNHSKSLWDWLKKVVVQWVFCAEILKFRVFCTGFCGVYPNLSTPPQPLFTFTPFLLLYHLPTCMRTYFFDSKANYGDHLPWESNITCRTLYIIGWLDPMILIIPVRCWNLCVHLHIINSCTNNSSIC